jgi:two-component system, NarL family, captular synthesis response regulator RcsB
MKINLVLADDHPVLIEGIKYALANINTLQVTGTARNSSEIVERLAEVPCDVLVTDYAMPGGTHGDGMALLSFLRRHYPRLPVIVFTTIENRAMVKEMSRMGIRSVLNKAGDVGQLVSAIHAVYAGATYFPPATKTLDFQMRDGRIGDGQGRDLTRREAEVLRLYVSGLSIREIAGKLHRTKQTVSAQKMGAMRKLGIERDADLYRFAHETGLMVGSEVTSPAE